MPLDPFLAEIVRSGQQEQPRYANVNDPLVNARRFAAPTREQAAANAVRTALEGDYEDKSFAAKAARLVGKMLLGSPHARQFDAQGNPTFDSEAATETALNWWNPAMGVAGILGKAKNPQLIKLAEELERTKKPAQEIWRRTGLERDAAGNWLREIPDDALQVINPNARTLGAAVSHPQAFAEYPQLVNLPLKMKIDATQGEAGSYLKGLRGMEAQAPSLEEIRPILAHEMQHGVQDLDKLPGGTNLERKTLAEYMREVGENQAENVEYRLLNPETRAFSPAMTERMARERQVISQDPRAVVEAIKTKSIPKHLQEFLKERGIPYKDLHIITTREEYANFVQKYGPPNALPRESGLPFGRGPSLFVEDAAGGKPVAIALDSHFNLPSNQALPGAVMQAVKPKGGMWHPEAVDRLAEPLYAKLSGGNGFGLRATLSIEPTVPANAKDLPAYTQARWSDRAIRNYLNKYAGTKEDPLKDVEVPFGEGTKRWEELMDQTIKAVPRDEAIRTRGVNVSGLSKARPDELIYDVSSGVERSREQGPWSQSAGRTIESYLSHVGDYLRQNVRPEKLAQYDLVRAVKETAANDARVAREMEKAAAASTKSLPVHKDYGDGFKWVELKLPKKLTPEQMKGVREATSGDDYHWGRPITEREGNKVKASFGYVAKDASGKDIKNSYTSQLAGGRTPEEAYLAGQLAQEGNQMGHCVGGYCEGVAAGESRIFSLRDAKGRSHVTVEVGKEAWSPEAIGIDELIEHGGLPRSFVQEFPWPEGFWHRYRGERNELLTRADLDAWRRFDRLPGVVAARQRMMHPDRSVPDIVQIKGKQNRAPTAEYLPYVQDFVRSGKWGEVGDLGNTGLVKNAAGEYVPEEWIKD